MNHYMTNRKRGESPLFCPSRSTPPDIEAIKRQMEKRNFSPSIIVATAKRCIWGFPQVIICRPVFRLKPFPTTFWLTCPWLVKKCGEWESRGGVKSLELFMLNRKETWSEYNMYLRTIRMSLLSRGERKFLRIYERNKWESLNRSIIGGIRENTTPTMKCLHLQVGAWLALGFHPGGKWLVKHFPFVNCDSACDFPCGSCGKHRRGK